MYKKILLATDGSTHMRRATAVITAFYKKWGCEIRIFHSIKHMAEKVSPPSHGWTVPYTSNAYFDVTTASDGVKIRSEHDPNIKILTDQEVEKIGEDILNGTKAFFDEVQVPVKTRLIIKEDPERYIERIVKKKNFDLVIVGITGMHSKLDQVLMGSVAEYVVENAQCDVLVIR
ncbi:MAG: universal stress protein [Candidatus Lokiarchaeota archaeon]|nr:universal stress protein [Candidatus Lokiarchaeota archaeon]